MKVTLFLNFKINKNIFPQKKLQRQFCDMCISIGEN